MARSPIPPISATKREIYALQALHKGEATPDQQKLVLKWLVWKAAQTHAVIEPVQSNDVTNFQLGRRSVGLALLEHLNTDPSKMKDDDTNG